MDTHTILYAPGLEEMALGIAAEIDGAGPVLCTSDLLGSGVPVERAGLCWEAFPSGDPNLKLRVAAVRDKHVVLIMNHDTLHLFEQLAVLLFLQRFNVPHPLPAYADGKWKATMRDGAYDVCSVASLTVVVPWCVSRACARTRAREKVEAGRARGARVCEWLTRIGARTRGSSKMAVWERGARSERGWRTAAARGEG